MSNQQQSPIHIQSPVVTKYAKQLKIRWSKHLDGTLTPHHGKVQVAFSGDKNERISFDGRDFQILQFHFHHKSEHWIEGKQFPMELHIVHQNCDPNDGKLAVLGIMIESDNSAKTAPSLIELMEAMSKDDTCECMEFKTNPHEWLPTNIEHYYRYEGSLTTPEYDEIVSWVVFKEPLKLPRKEINKLIRCAAEPARLPQPLNRRFVLSNFS
ncbi:Carbonic anhydrase precursor [Rubripirellula lacrimiformis]|uniref:Carbonic anhydrase n=1 Tax=Rubripirellula lacrimiformis TaxID=1930273 RepID=A0A517N7I0_9BACT|nr:carbonic anhydrase family protein [Rubripirellula lacrimiformis]QDT03099.1 Carbonic anhydrase precursor [Rubripirellula lacrimiformis]